jgi:hypothetical protein
VVWDIGRRISASETCDEDMEALEEIIRGRNGASTGGPYLSEMQKS